MRTITQIFLSFRRFLLLHVDIPITFLDFYYNTNVKYHTGYNKYKLSYG